MEFSTDGRKMIDVQKIFHQMEQKNPLAQHTNFIAAKLEDAHSAEADVAATAEILEAPGGALSKHRHNSRDNC